MDGTTVPAVKRALVAALQARPGLADVTVAYQAPEKASDVTNDSGLFDAVWLDAADSGVVAHDANIKAPPHEFDEEYDVLVVVQSLRPVSDGTQEVTDQRCSEMLAELVGLLASTNALIEKTATNPFCIATYQGFTENIGTLAPGHGTRYEALVHIQARLALA